MQQDARGLALSTDVPAAAAAFDAAIQSYLRYRTDGARHLEAALAADPGFAMAHLLRGYFAMLSFNRANVPAAAAALAEARRGEAGLSPRERRHAEALAAWIDGRLWAMLGAWEAILADHPTDVLALRLAHFNYFWLGEVGQMRQSVLRAQAGWADDLPGYGTVLSCIAFGHEECGDYRLAEAAGRAAVERDPLDLWGTHAVAHVMEMEGRHRDGVAWLDGLKGHWEGAAAIVHHMWWHRALYHWELGEFDQVLALYDERFRNLDSPLTKAMPDLYIDAQNAAAMLWRLERAGVNVGGRWAELADRAEARAGDSLSAFTQPHWMLALAATGRTEAAGRLVADLHAAGEGGGTLAPVHAGVTAPLATAVLAHRAGDWRRVVDLLWPIRNDFWRLGGSHAQRDIFRQMLADAAARAGDRNRLRMILTEETVGRTLPLTARRGYAPLAIAA
ncbi:tetratricopeptide repeat protein 38 family protein [Allostella humosa]|nr:tetratricopeptide repeat protein 38 family protein [Stella humosa]